MDVNLLPEDARWLLLAALEVSVNKPKMHPDKEAKWLGEESPDAFPLILANAVFQNWNHTHAMVAHLRSADFVQVLSWSDWPKAYIGGFVLPGGHHVVVSPPEGKALPREKHGMSFRVFLDGVLIHGTSFVHGREPKTWALKLNKDGLAAALLLAQTAGNAKRLQAKKKPTKRDRDRGKAKEKAEQRRKSEDAIVERVKQARGAGVTQPRKAVAKDMKLSLADVNKACDASRRRKERK